MTDHDCNELDQVGEQGPYALLEAAVKRIDEKDALIRQLQAELAEALTGPPVLVFMDDIPAGFYEREVMDEVLGMLDEAPDTRDPDDYELIQKTWLGYCE